MDWKSVVIVFIVALALLCGATGCQVYDLKKAALDNALRVELAKAGFCMIQNVRSFVPCR